MIVDGIVFGIGHAAGAEIIQLLALAAFGMGLCLLYWRTQSIIPCMALHALNNSITFGVTKDLEPALFAGVVVLSVGSVVGGGMAVPPVARWWPHEAVGARAGAAVAGAARHGRRPDPSARADPGAHAHPRRQAHEFRAARSKAHARRSSPAARSRRAS